MPGRFLSPRASAKAFFWVQMRFRERVGHIMKGAVLLELAFVISTPGREQAGWIRFQPGLEIGQSFRKLRCAVHIGLGDGGQLRAEPSQYRMPYRFDEGAELRRRRQGLAVQQHGPDFDDFHLIPRCLAAIAAGGLEIDDEEEGGN